MYNSIVVPLSIGLCISRKISFPFFLSLSLSRNLIIFHSIDWLTYKPLHPFFRRQAHVHFTTRVTLSKWIDFFSLRGLKAQSIPKHIGLCGSKEEKLKSNSKNRSAWHLTIIQIIIIYNTFESIFIYVCTHWKWLFWFLFLRKLNEYRITSHIIIYIYFNRYNWCQTKWNEQTWPTPKKNNNNNVQVHIYTII